ncbi:MAG: hypothetical protein AAGH15_04530 [Myxococcota bacterium]
MYRPSASFALPALGLLALLASPAAAQEGLAGTWQHAGGGQESAAREAAIEAATEELSRMIRSRARGRLAERTTPAPRLQITVAGDAVTITGPNGRLALTVGGPAVRVEGQNGSGQVRATRRGGNLVVTMRGDGGTQTTTYRLSEDGRRLVLQVEMRGERLSAPLRFRATYRRR